MDARKLLSTSTLDSEVVGLMMNAFDRAWTEVGTYFMGSEVGDARTILAKAILGNAFDCHDMDELRRLAIRALIFHYPWLAESQDSFKSPRMIGLRRSASLVLRHALRCRTIPSIPPQPYLTSRSMRPNRPRKRYLQVNFPKHCIRTTLSILHGC